jgi:hypothetical protein
MSEPPGETGSDPSLSDRSQAIEPPAIPLPPPETLSDEEVKERAAAARHRDPTRVTGDAG